MGPAPLFRFGPDIPVWGSTRPHFSGDYAHTLQNLNDNESIKGYEKHAGRICSINLTCLKVLTGPVVISSATKEALYCDKIPLWTVDPLKAPWQRWRGKNSRGMLAHWANKLKRNETNFGFCDNIIPARPTRAIRNCKKREEKNSTCLTGFFLCFPVTSSIRQLPDPSTTGSGGSSSSSAAAGGANNASNGGGSNHGPTSSSTSSSSNQHPAGSAADAGGSAVIPAGESSSSSKKSSIFDRKAKMPLRSGAAGGAASEAFNCEFPLSLKRWCFCSSFSR